MKPTNRESVRSLARLILSRLENLKAIAYAPQARESLRDKLLAIMGQSILTEQDLHEKTLETIGAKADDLNESQHTESAQYRTAKSIVRKSFGDDQLNGFYFQKPMRNIAKDICRFLMETSEIEDVFETDDQLEQLIVGVIKQFDEGKMH